MSFLKGLGQFAGEVTGKVLGGTVRVVGEVAGSEFIKDIGNSVEKVTIETGKTVGQLASGTFDVAKGVITQNEGAVDQGVHDIGGAVRHTAAGVVSSAQYVYDNGKDIVAGLQADDMERVKQGAKGIVKAAAVGAIAIGVIDFVDGPDGHDSAGISADADNGGAGGET